MNKFDERYEIRLARYEDIEDIMEFIDLHWKKNHIMSQDRELFEYEFIDERNVNFVLAIDRETFKIEAILGFIKSSNTSNPEKMDIWGSFWKVNEENNNLPLLGLELARRIYDLTNCRTYICNGINPENVVPIRKLIFGDITEKMNHYYYLNPFINDYRIAVVSESNKSRGESVLKNTEMIEFKSIEEIEEKFTIDNIDQIPYKDSWYLNKRYFQHPYYSYLVYGLKDEEGNIGALIVARELEVKEIKILRIVDYIGEQELFAGLKNQFEKMFKEKKYEYIDFYTCGFKEKYILNAGFILRDESDKNIIPNYFEPFLQRNIDIWVHYEKKDTLFFKADGDQDRPNELR